MFITYLLRLLYRKCATGVGLYCFDELLDVVECEEENNLPKLAAPELRTQGGVRHSLVGVPAVVEFGETLRVELDVERLPESVSASLEPSFGAATPETDLPLAGLKTDTSRIWGDRIYAVARFEVPGTDRRFTEGLYDLRVTFDGEADGQPRAVSVRDPFPEDPEIAIMGHPHVGDPRPCQDGGRKSLKERNPNPFLLRYRETSGTGTGEDRWGAFQRANAEPNAENPDIVVVIGDLAFGSANYYQEYEDAYRVLNQLDAPTYVTLGNHDGYITPGAGIDGKELYRRYFAPWYYSVDIPPDLHFVSMDSYDWPALDRVAPTAVPSTWGGQVRDPQFEWLADDLRSWRAANPDGTILTLSHHNPSWRRTEKGEATRTTGGIPGAEQAARGAERFGGGWLGDNRLAVRNLLAEVGVTLHLSGHTHRDRVARYHGNDTVVATTGTGLEHVGPDNELLDTPPDERRAHHRGGRRPTVLGGHHRRLGHEPVLGVADRDAEPGGGVAGPPALRLPGHRRVPRSARSSRTSGARRTPTWGCTRRPRTASTRRWLPRPTAVWRFESTATSQGR